MAQTAGDTGSEDRAGWRRLGLFWLGALTLLLSGGGILQILGPPNAVVQIVKAPLVKAPLVKAPIVTAAAASHGPAARDDLTNVVVVARPAPLAIAGSGRGEAGPIADPDPAMLEPADLAGSDHKTPENLPRVAHDGRVPMRVYAAGFDPSSRRPRIGVLMAGVGLNEAESDAAIRALPGAVSLGVSPYAAAKGTGLTRLLATARATGHEYLLELPLEPAGFPLNDPGPSTLLTSLSTTANAGRLRWILSRIDGYAGAVGITGTMRGERLAGMPDQMDRIVTELASRGLLYIDPRVTGEPVSKEPMTKVWGRHADLVIDEPMEVEAIDRKLARLEQLAKDQGAALGLVTRPAPVVVARIAAWSLRLAERGAALAPVSALTIAPVEPVIRVTERAH